MGPNRIAIIPRRVIWLGAALIVLAAALAWWFWPDGATEIRIYSPAGFRALEIVEGRCWTGSLAAPRQGAFRCMSGNAIYDPCFDMGTDQVACPGGNPALNQGVLINLEEPLPGPPDAWENPPDLDDPVPWYVALAGGGECTVLTGTRLPDFPYGCRFEERADAPGGYGMQPLPLAGDPAKYATVGGFWDDETKDIVDRLVYLVRAMWL
ncbi:MAG TPA: hypothetical protein GXX29_07825 [Firmicutes bacterium]|nr:hypothetical protein [Bacillota bacterium]